MAYNGLTSQFEKLFGNIAAEQTQVKANAAALAAAMSDMGYKIVSGGTDNHCILIDLRTKFPE